MADMAKVMAEPNMEKRSQAALVYASETLSESRKAYSAGEMEKAAQLLDEMEKAVVLAEKSLTDSGKDANRSPKYFKDAEIKLGQLLRRLDGFSSDMNVADRPAADKVKETVQQVHDRILLSIMKKKKK
jgi:hypothetical protein